MVHLDRLNSDTAQYKAFEWYHAILIEKDRAQTIQSLVLFKEKHSCHETSNEQGVLVTERLNGADVL